jgi:hypothetical protein
MRAMSMTRFTTSSGIFAIGRKKSLSKKGADLFSKKGSALYSKKGGFLIQAVEFGGSIG